MNYMWSEDRGGLEASVFIRIHLDYLTKCVEENPDIKEIIIHSDCCVHQNKNDTQASALRRCAAKHNMTVTWKHLQVGHTYMECDSAHRCIENQIAKQDVNVPRDYVNIIKRARNNPVPYQVRFNDILPYSFFKNYESLKQDVPSI